MHVGWNGYNEMYIYKKKTDCVHERILYIGNVTSIFFFFWLRWINDYVPFNYVWEMECPFLKECWNDMSSFEWLSNDNDLAVY